MTLSIPPLPSFCSLALTGLADNLERSSYFAIVLVTSGKVTAVLQVAHETFEGLWNFHSFMGRDHGRPGLVIASWTSSENRRTLREAFAAS